MTGGERRLAQRLIDKLEDDYLCWYDVPIGPKGSHPDFVVLNPRRGLLILEVKDWRLDTIQSADRASVTLLTNAGLRIDDNPLEQARQFAHLIVGLLERDPQLTVHEEGRYQNRLCFPWGYGAVLANITRKAIEGTDLGEVIHPDRVICQDEMFEWADPEQFQQRLWNMFTVGFKTLLSLPQIDRIRWHLFPEIRIRSDQLVLIDSPGTPQSVADTVPDLLKVMDLQQEQLARNLGEGHRIIHGVAGSGKTLILGYRCERLAPLMQKPILVLCYNRALAAKLWSAIKLKNLEQKVRVRTFHSWCLDQLRLYNVPVPPSGPEFYDATIESVIAAVERGQIPRAQYGAVMVDEGHDFKPEWLKIVTQMVDPSTNSLLVLYDDAQSIYDANRRPKFSFSSVGIQAQGRTTILRLNYRNTSEVLSVAYEFAKDFLTPAEAEEDGVPLVAPQSAGRRGPVPVLNQLASLEQEGDFIAKELTAINKKGWPWREMAVLFRAGFIGERTMQRLKAAGIPVHWMGDAEGKRAYVPSADSVKVMTMHSSKGLEFPVVAISGLDRMPFGDQHPGEEAKLLYVAMTRAMEMLLMTCSRETEFVKRIKEARSRAVA
ncbi:MAG: NERD domain-containing protein [Betaproteobacteria bacterium]|nr:NERD domain-containing protein [Betaproteobacteria bacterium]